MADIKQAHVCTLDALVEAAKASAECANAERQGDPNQSRVCSDTADLCWMGANLLARGSHFISIVLKGIAEALELCAKSCSSHGSAHCKRCGEACSAAAREARRLLGELPVEGIATGQWSKETRAS
jgi:hypothetical protein